MISSVDNAKSTFDNNTNTHAECLPSCGRYACDAMVRLVVGTIYIKIDLRQHGWPVFFILPNRIEYS
jgi:hypothetical protein